MLQIVLHIDGDSGQAEEFESGLLHFHPVIAGAHSREGVKTAVSSCHLDLNAALYVNQANCGAGDDSTRWISDRTVDTAGFRLRVAGRDHARGKEENKSENG